MRASPARAFLFVALLILLLLVSLSAHSYLHAYRLLRFLEAPPRTAQIATRDLTLPAGSTNLRARAYLPAHPHHAPVLLLIPGVHHLGIDEPRLVAFARALAREGVLVLTPELPGIADYRIEPDDIPLLGGAALAARNLTGAPQVGVMGLSFSGGLALIAAAQPPYAAAIHYVIAVGAHDSMQRVARFYASGSEEFPDGSSRPFVPNHYGPLVMAYEHPEDYVAPDQTAAVRSVLRPYLYEDEKSARATLATLPAPLRSQLDAWISNKPSNLGALILSEADKRGDDMARVSPHGNLGGLRARVLLLHGAGDDVIPPAELLFLERDIPAAQLDTALISPAISHVSLAQPNWRDKLTLLRWMARMFRRIDDGATGAQKLAPALQ